MDASTLPQPLPQPPHPPQVAPPLKVIWLILPILLVFFIIGLFIVFENWFRRLFGLPPIPPPPTQVVVAPRLPQRPTRTQRRLKRRILRSIPVLSFDAEQSNLSAECGICLTEFVGGDRIRILPQCGHGFHVVCIDMWLNSQFFCPNCRQDLTGEQVPQP